VECKCSGVRGRHPNESTIDRPRPLPRQKRLSQDQDDDDAKPLTPTGRSAIDRRTPPSTNDQRLTPRTPTSQRRSPADDRDVYGSRYDTSNSESRRHDFCDRQSPHFDVFRRSPQDRRELSDERESSERYPASRKSPKSSSDRNSPAGDHRLSNSSSRKSPLEGSRFTKSGQHSSSSTDQRKTPLMFQQQNRDRLSPQRKGSVVDFLTEPGGLREDEVSDEERTHRVRRKSGSPYSRGTSPSMKRSESTEKNPFDDIRRRSPAAVPEVPSQNRGADSVRPKPARRSLQVDDIVLMMILALLISKCACL